MSEQVGPDTGFKLRPLIQEVLGASDATEPDELALEVLGRIAEYDREAALFQALKALVRESWRPRFIPVPRPVAEPATVLTPQNPPPERDGRQWMERDATDEAPRARSWAEVREQRRPDEGAVADHRVALDAEVDAPDPAPEWSEAEPLGWAGPDDQVDWEVYRRDGAWVGVGYNRMTQVGTTKPCRTKLGLMLAARRVTGRHPMTFLWDDK